jgi:zinc protease
MRTRILLLQSLLFLALGFVSLLAQATPAIDHWVLANGTRVYFVESHELPMVRVSLVFDAGSARDAKGKAGQAALVSHLLSEGAGDLDGDEIARRLEGLGAELSGDADRDITSVGLRTLSDDALLYPALDLLAAIVRDPAFPESSLDRERGRLLVGLKQAEETPGDIAERAFYRTVFGDHPYAHDPSGERESVQGITRNDLVAFHRQYYVGANAVLVMVGDLKKRQARRIALRVAGGLPKGKRAAALPAISPLTQAQRRDIAHPSSQTHILMGQPGMRRGDPDYFPLYVGNHILGGSGLVSRLSNEVREKRGLSYSVYSYFYPLRLEGPYVIGLQTRNEKKAEAETVLRNTLRAFIENGPGDAELQAAKKNLTGGFPLRIDNSGKIASYLAVLGFYDLPLTYLDDFNGHIEAVTAAQIRDAFRRRIHPDRLVAVTVGGKN